MSCLESHGERLVAPPVRRQHRAEEVRAVGPDQLARVVRKDVHHVPGVRSWPDGPCGGHGPVAVSNLAAGEGCGGRREPSGGRRLYGNMHHNSLGQCHLTGSDQRSKTLWREKFLSVSPDDAGVKSPLCWRKGWRRERRVERASLPEQKLQTGDCVARSSAHNVSARAAPEPTRFALISAKTCK